MTLLLNKKTGFFTLFTTPEQSSSICDKFRFAGASAVIVTRNDHHERSCSKEILKKVLIRNLISKKSNSGLALTKRTVTHLLCMIDLLIIIKYASAKMPIRSCARKAPYATGYCCHLKRLLRLNKQRAFSVRVRNLFNLVFVRISPDGLSNKDQVLKPPKSCCV